VKVRPHIGTLFPRPANETRLNVGQLGIIAPAIAATAIEWLGAADQDAASASLELFGEGDFPLNGAHPMVLPTGAEVKPQDMREYDARGTGLASRRSFAEPRANGQ
jgi:hypothetical protein